MSEEQTNSSSAEVKPDQPEVNNSANDNNQATKEDIEKNKSMAIVAYILFFIPLLMAKESKFAMYHANQGLVLFIVALGISIVGTVIPVIGWLLILPLGQLFVFVLLIIGIINAAKGRMKPLPVIGEIKILD